MALDLVFSDGKVGGTPLLQWRDAAGHAKDLGVTQARVSQIRSEALTSLRAWFGTLYEGAPEVGDDDPDLALILHG